MRRAWVSVYARRTGAGNKIVSFAARGGRNAGGGWKMRALLCCGGFPVCRGGFPMGRGVDPGGCGVSLPPCGVPVGRNGGAPPACGEAPRRRGDSFPARGEVPARRGGALPASGVAPRRHGVAVPAREAAPQTARGHSSGFRGGPRRARGRSSDARGRAWEPQRRTWDADFAPHASEQSASGAGQRSREPRVHSRNPQDRPRTSRKRHAASQLRCRRAREHPAGARPNPRQFPLPCFEREPRACDDAARPRNREQRCVSATVHAESGARHARRNRQSCCPLLRGAAEPTPVSTEPRDNPIKPSPLKAGHKHPGLGGGLFVRRFHKSPTVIHFMKTILLLLLGFISWQSASGVDFLESGTSLASPDSRWKVSTEKEDSGDFTSRIFIAAQGANGRTLLAENGRHFGAEWSPDSKTLLVYDNLGSGQSDTIVFRQTEKGWKQIYRTPGGFHIIWRLDKWLPDAVRLRSHSGGSSADKDVPSTVLVPFDASKSRQAPAPANKQVAPATKRPSSKSKRSDAH